MKKRVSLTIDSDVLKVLDKRVDGIFIKSRSDAVEKVLKEHVLEKKTAVVLAGGAPERLLVNETSVYRPLVDIGKMRLVEYVIGECRKAGFDNIIIIGFSQVISKIYEVVGNGEKYGVNVTFIEEKRELGTAKTLELAKQYLTSDFLFLPCDSFFNFDLKKLWEFHRTHNGTVTIGIHTRTSYDWNKGVVEMDGYNITSYEEKPKKPKTRLFSVFIGFMRPEVFNIIPPGDVSWSLQEQVFPKLASEGKLIGYPIAGDWVNVHSAKDVSNLARVMKKQK